MNRTKNHISLGNYKIVRYHLQRYRGWDFLPQIESWQMHGKTDYNYKHYYCARFELRAFREIIGVEISRTIKWK